MKLLAKTVVTVGASVAMLGGLAPVASAAPAAEAPVTPAVTCSGTGCDNKDPRDTGCSATRRNVGSQTTTKGTFVLYYSTACRTNWIEVGNYAGGSTRPDGKLELTVWDRARNKTVRFYAEPTRGPHWGNMVYSPGTSCAIGYADWSGGAWDVRIPSPGC